MLNERLLKFQKDIFNTDSSIRVTFNDDLRFVTAITEVTGSSALTSLQNNIKIVENKVTTFCNNKVGTIGDGFDWYTSIIGQNSKYLKPGETLEIQAGIGAFSTRGNPEIVIDGKLSKINEDGYVLYKTKTPNKPGTYSIPVHLSFVNPTTGKDESWMVNVNYTIAKPCN